MVKIQFSNSFDEPTLPTIFLTKSSNGQTGTATFLFKKPLIFSHSTKLSIKINEMSLVWGTNQIKTNDITIHFYQGKPFLLESLFIFTSDLEWFNFFIFMNQYSKETGLFYSEYSEEEN